MFGPLSELARDSFGVPTTEVEHLAKGSTGRKRFESSPLGLLSSLHLPSRDCENLRWLHYYPYTVSPVLESEVKLNSALPSKRGKGSFVDLASEANACH
jgi:hypothetical protein